MISYLQIAQAVLLYNGITRRQDEPYVMHALRKAEYAKTAGLGNKIQLLCLLHNVLELLPDLRANSLGLMYKLEEIDLIALKLLTPATDETPEQHFERILNGQCIFALIVKYLACYDDAIFSPQHKEYYHDYLKIDYKIERDMYISQMNRLEAKLTEYGHPIPLK